MKDKLRTTLDERGVSPVIGVILMVAITVILAAVIGSFVLGIGGDVEQAPQASLQVDFEADEIVHNGGDDVDLSEVEIQGAGGSPSTYSGDFIDSGDGDGVLTPGEKIESNGGDFSLSGSVTVVHNSSGKIIVSAEE